ncbi:MAG TPA: 3'(2'),5'-bisphosphate nucleotidase CysQ [Salinivirga sp.]|uniref:3'(2'),5'-bisphosphate nucleotidase CysQ family protein n=1 Tax=Salinivirga sp. TaxID=1970192 RepID=UPI002B4628EE|nr:3'(2'),5'-bisphosphate nucleotidase CysQ [Salinivirga sp.]HKK59428.1 3'(2'),5'-bisphosphate nucleotidase CysQ [Salinivirga sp.]
MERIRHALDAALKASHLIMKYYEGEIEVETKADQSPVTIADKEADELIRKVLEDTGIPILSEEHPIPPHDERLQWEQFWMVDPLDGTKEFIKKNGEFTINIALLENNVPVGGVIAAPASNIVYFGESGYGSFKSELSPETENLNDIFKNVTPLQPEDFKNGDTLKVAVSRSHLDDTTVKYIEKLKKDHDVDTTSAGSAIKIGLLAEGKAHIYPRFSPCMEWDIAAGFGIVNQLDFQFISTENQKKLNFNKKDLHVNGFIALRDKKFL